MVRDNYSYSTVERTYRVSVEVCIVQDKMKLPPERVAELNMRRREYKWSLILAQVELE